MSTFVGFRDGGKTNEEGFYRQFRKLLSTVGVMSSSDLAVSQRGAGANKSVDIAAGDAFFEYEDYVFYGWNTATVNDSSTVITDNTSGNPRIDAVVAYIDLTVIDDTDSNNPDALKFEVVPGTPAGSPSAPDDAAIQSAIGSGNPYIRLANVAVANGFSSIVNANITDTRPVTAFSSGVLSTDHFAPSGFLVNGQIVRSVNSNNLTVAIKGMDGDDPSPTNPVYVRIGNTVRTITSALAVTKNAGTNWFNAGSTELATQELDLFVYLGWNGTDGVTIGFSKIPYARVYGDFHAIGTNDRYAAISTITNATSTDEYELVGRFNAILGAGGSYNWSLPATAVIINRPIFNTRRLTFAPVWTGSSSMTFTPTAYQTYHYQIEDGYCEVTLGVRGTVANQHVDIQNTLPFPAIYDASSTITGAGARIANGSAYAGVVSLNSTTQVQIKRYDGGNWANGANTDIQYVFRYPIV